MDGHHVGGAEQTPWVPAAMLRTIVEESGADPDLLVDLAQVRGELVDDATDAPNCRGLRASPPP